MLTLLQDRVKIMTVNFNESSEGQEHHTGARDFVFWNLPQVGLWSDFYITIMLMR